MVNPRLRVIFHGLGLLCAVSLAGAAAGQSHALENQVKGVFLAKFAAYVMWPPAALGAPSEPIKLCIIGRDPFGGQLDQIVAGQRVDLHPFLIRRLSGTAAAAGCQIAFLGGTATQGISAMSDALRGKAILTVTDAALGAERGIVHFTLKDGRVRFYIDDAQAAQANLAISARLLSLALIVNPRPQPS
ncbi:MAG TPA: YfiR family protein [Sphingomonas sp.]|nr:YfiR family protein [Sphingomonas sp.]